MKADAQFSRLLLAVLPELRAFALSLTHDGVGADDLVQETLLRAWSGAERFQEGSNIRAWLFTILRNLFCTERRRRRREVDDPEGKMAARLRIDPDQPSHLEFEDVRTALRSLVPVNREALILVGAQGLSYEEAAEVCGVAVGTIKSRVNRARVHLMEVLQLETGYHFGPDDVLKAVVGSEARDT
ncbi:sigma-70 family RNA polymerase sigma factor [Microvirga tunisiensis]|uniref:RNA polymerase sigma factor n=1 Tax=Microvirga tunisiensis TaxID=2108360 RepID=A0A5N7MLI2_9HYPH|nr:sigma-70 family RNA polymerase sigma factor [Microvirga tunisiensis]MPR10185.1 sigma-70 family RNA polymerase sigma factor [Microvirga tunisiensis]MPR27733.1 sigma-70 family RNA polymerase sigma factor [Microvirga tunisiensis]